MEIVRLDDITSTNDYLIAMQTRDELCVVTDYQSAGKGMGSNTWESEHGKNLLFSILIHPVWLDVSRQYLMSMAEALALRDAILPLVPKSDSLTIKWPNDIYYGDKKLSGTRIDVNLQGWQIQDMVIGTGININQREFRSNAPNPVSLVQITGKEHDADELLRSILLHFDYYREMLEHGNVDSVVSLYHAYLYRGNGMYEYEDAEGVFEARLHSVAPNGMMTLRRSDGTLSSYEFKEVKFRI
jgi:BirA family biotin operon repressor/biotin-[acetyl-CoA-carboxylase] ligase